MINDVSSRLLVPTSEDRGVIPQQLFDMWGHVLLPAKWDLASWVELDKNTKRFIYSVVADHWAFFTHIYMPFKAKSELGYDDAKMAEIYPNGLPEFWRKDARMVQQHCPLELLASEYVPGHSDIWQIASCQPTGHFKSSRFLEALPLWLIGINPSVTILAASATMGQAKRYPVSLKSHIISNEKFKYVFGNLHTEDSREVWSAEEFTVDRPYARVSPTFRAIGQGASLEGERFDVELADDVADDENSRTQRGRDQLWNWHTSVFSKRLNANTRFQINVGTPHNRGDLLDRLETQAQIVGDVVITKRPIFTQGTWPPKRIDPEKPYHVDNIIVPNDLDLIWPEFWSPDKVCQDYLLDSQAFARTRLLQYQDAATLFFPPHIVDQCCADGGVRDDGALKPCLSRWPEDLGIPTEGTSLYQQYASFGFIPSALQRFISVDLAVSEKSRSVTDPDYTVLQLWARCPVTQSRIILNQSRFRTRDPLEIEKKLKKWVHAYNPYKLIVEALAVDRLYARKLQDVIGMPVTIREFRKANKVESIESFKDLVYSGLIWIPWAADTFSENQGTNYNTRKVFASFVEELCAYPLSGHDDTLAAAVHANCEMRGGSSEAHVRVLGMNNLQDQWETAMQQARLEKAAQEQKAVRDVSVGLDEVERKLLTILTPGQGQKIARGRDPWGRNFRR